MRHQSGGVPAATLVVIALGLFGVLLWANAQPAPALQVIVPTQVQPTENPNAWQQVLREGFGSDSTPLPTVPIPAEPFVPPTLERSSDSNVIPLQPGDIGGGVLPTFTPYDAAATPTLPAATPTLLATNVPVTVQPVTRPPELWQPPPLIPPLSRDPLGRDHYWFIRPVDSNATNFGLFYYPFGSNGPEQQNPSIVHHGIDMPNPVGETVRAAGSGRVEWARPGGIFQNSPSYGNVVEIEHDFSYRGQPLFTLYAHLSSILAQEGSYVNAGDVIGLVGQSGRVSGPHVHFEVRLGENAYAASYNPLLWMVPYVGTGVIAGRVTDENGDAMLDLDVTVRNWATGQVADTTTTYVIQDTGYDVRSDPNWQENFAVSDLPEGRYVVIVNIHGDRETRTVDVYEGRTSFVDLFPQAEAATPQPVSTEES